MALHSCAFYILRHGIKISISLDLKKSKTDLETLKKQAEATNSEYDRLSSEFQKLQVSILLL